MKILISAYACEPGAGSEPGAGWAWARAASLSHDVWVLTRANNAVSIEAALRKEPELRLRPIYLDLPGWARWWKRGGRGVHLYYMMWQVLAWREGRRLHSQIGFDVAHHLTFAADWLPAAVVWIRGLPAIWGPVGGATGTPWRLWRWLGFRGLVGEGLRDVVTRLLRRLVGDAAARRAHLVVAQNEDVAQRFASHRPTVEPNIALDPTDFPALDGPVFREHEGTDRRAVFVGRLISWKGPRLAVSALAEPAAGNWSLDLYGDGADRRGCERLVRTLGIRDRVQFHGKRPRAEVLRAMRNADALLFPSMHDSTGWVVGEAVSLGTPVVCLDRGGPPSLISGVSECISVPASGRVVKELGNALHRTALLSRMKSRSTWTWERLPALLDGWYADAAARSHLA